MRGGVQAVLFDLDGTLVDSAPDLAGTTNDLLARRGRPAVPYGSLRPLAGTGARGMLQGGFGLAPGMPGYEALRDEFHEHYASRMLQHTRVFDAVPGLLRALGRSGLPWGIVTNKATRFAQPLVSALALDGHRVLVAGDTTPHTKPHPAPLLEAVHRLGLSAGACVYVGDDHRDMVAGRAAGMRVLAAAWGYGGEGDEIHAWQADHVLQQPHDLLNWLELA